MTNPNNPNNPSIPEALQSKYNLLLAAMDKGEITPIDFAQQWAAIKSAHDLAEAERQRAVLEELMASSARVHVSKRTETTAGGRVVFSGGGLAMRSDNCTPDQFIALSLNTGNVFGVGIAVMLDNVNGQLPRRETRKTRGENAREYDIYALGDCITPKPREFVLKLLAAARHLNVPIPVGFRSAGVLGDGSDDPDIVRVG
jgi:head-tail adaptor